VVLVPFAAGLGWFAASAALAGVAAVAALALVALNQRLYRFFLRRRGPLFLLGALALHWLYFLYCAAAAAVALAAHLGARRRKPRPVSAAIS
jgi:hypothetical protein